MSNTPPRNIHEIMYDIMKKAGLNPDHHQFEKMKATSQELVKSIDAAAQIQALAIMRRLQTATRAAFTSMEAELDKLKARLDSKPEPASEEESTNGRSEEKNETDAGGETG